MAPAHRAPGLAVEARGGTVLRPPGRNGALAARSARTTRRAERPEESGRLGPADLIGTGDVRRAPAEFAEWGRTPGRFVGRSGSNAR